VNDEELVQARRLRAVGIFLLAVSGLFAWKFITPGGNTTAEFVLFAATFIAGLSLIAASR
jgi:hypothetical protein